MGHTYVYMTNESSVVNYMNSEARFTYMCIQYTLLSPDYNSGIGRQYHLIPITIYVGYST